MKKTKKTTVNGTTQPKAVDVVGMFSPKVDKWNRRVKTISRLVGGK